MPEGAPQPGFRRAGESLDAAAVDAWLRGRIPDLGPAGSLPRITQYSGGSSNWTYRLEYPEHDLVLRRPPAGTKAKSAHDMGREYRVQKALARAYPLVPEMLAFCTDPEVLGCDFYVMRRIDGIVPGKRLGVGLDADGAHRLGGRFLDSWIVLHEIDPRAVELDSLGKGPGYARRQIEGWSERYRRARTWNSPRFERVMGWLAERIPEDTGASVIHNDFRLDNVVLDRTDPTRIVGVLDWEMATVGDPLMDLGAGLAYWIEPDDPWWFRGFRLQPSDLPGMPTRADLIRRYCSVRQLDLPETAFYEVYGLFRLAAIIQQIYYRYWQRQTRNPKFRWFWLMAHALERRCLSLI